MIEKEKITQGVVNIFKVNMGLKSSEKVLVVTDSPTVEEWMKYDSEKLSDFVERSVLAKMVYEIAREKFPDCSVEFFTYPSVGKHGSEPGNETEERMKASDVAIAITTYSLTHTEARENATRAGVRVASMPTFLPQMFYRGGPMASDYRKIDEDSRRLAKLMKDGKEAIVTSPGGTNMKFLTRDGRVDTGIFTGKGAWGNLPSGETYCAPIEGSGEGKIVVEAGWFPNLKEDMTIVLKNGRAVEINGGGKVGDEFRDLLSFDKSEEPYISRRNFAELGIGTNPNAKKPDNILEAEKIKGTVHLAIGDGSHLGGKVSSDIHQDFVIPRPTLLLDGKTVIKHGEWLF